MKTFSHFFDNLLYLHLHWSQNIKYPNFTRSKKKWCLSDKKDQKLKDSINMGSLVAQDNRTTPLLVLQCVNWATTDRENREVNRKSKIYRIDIQQWRVPFAFNCTIWDVIFQILKIYSIYTKRATFLYWSRSWQLKYYMITNTWTWCSGNFFRGEIMQYH